MTCGVRNKEINSQCAELLVRPLYIEKRLKNCTVRLLLSAVLGRTKFWSQKPRINEVRG